tara:strand:+ start:173 stop:379 length:207 start_codon:yes stop_codon:yes gene_type:complete
MPVAIDLNDLKKKIAYTFHRVANQFESKYGLISQKLTSNFQKEKTDIEFDHYKLKKFTNNAAVFFTIQ